MSNLIEKIYSYILNPSLSETNSHSQGGEDKQIYKIFTKKKDGFYVDVGAHDPKLLSNSYLFYKLGWHGICIEANKNMIDYFRKKRPRDKLINVAASNRGGEASFYLGLHSGHASLLKTKNTNLEQTKVPLKKLENILDELKAPNEFDFISVDTEGTEVDVLEGLNLNRYKPRLIIVEYNTARVINRRLQPYLVSKGYQVIFINKWNMIFSNNIEQDSLLLHNSTNSKVTIKMTCKAIAKRIIKTNKWLEKRIYKHYNAFKKKKGIRTHWTNRIKNVLASPDNQYIPRNPNAGKIINNRLIMHNGITVNPLGYYGKPILKMLKKNKGVHEPQEERVFGEVLKKISNNGTIVELGSYWAFYSMWFYKLIKNAKCYMIEPDKVQLKEGENNFKQNNMKGFFYQAYLGDVTQNKNKSNIKTVKLDDFAYNQEIDFIDIVHSDIQGAELEMLKSATALLNKKKIGYFFISTHSNKLHSDCKNFLKKYGFITIASANLNESYSWDGVLIMRLSSFNGIEPINISKK